MTGRACRPRDLGYFGRGFYTATTKKHASNYGHRVLSVRLRPGSQLLNGMAGTAPTPQTLNPVRRPSYHEAFRTFVPLLAPIDRRDRVLREFDDLYDPEQPEFDRLGWYKLVTEWVEKSGVAAGVRWGHEVVLTDPAEIASVSSRNRTRRRPV